MLSGNSVRPILALAALVAVANRALSATEIKQLYNAGRRSPPAFGSAAPSE